MRPLKSTLAILALFISLTAFSQAIQRNLVVIEIGTGTWCQYCPGASNAAEQMVAEGKSVAVIENHNGDTYANTYSNTRNSYYAITGYPTSKFDGIAGMVGGAACPGGNVYSDFIPLYNQRMAVPAPVSLCFAGTHTGNAYTVAVSLKKLAAITSTTLKLHLVLTESNIAQTWQGCMSEVNYVTRLMVPDASGTLVSFATNDIQNVNLNFTVDPAYVTSNCQLVAFLQDNSTKEIFNGIMSPLNSIPATMFNLNDFSASPTSGCAPVPVSFTTTQANSPTLSWSFPGGNPSTSTITNPLVTYSSAGVYSAVLKGTNGVCSDQIVKQNYISISDVPASPALPQGNVNMCLNPPDETYTTSAVSGADSYTWSIEPAAAGILSPNGVSCSVNWDNGWHGTAILKVKASSVCGSSIWSPELVVNVFDYPVQCTVPTGTSVLCKNTPSTSYSTSISTSASTYYWSLDPQNAGTPVQGGITTSVYWDANFSGTATLKVKAMNGSCEGIYSNPLSIAVTDLPTAFNVTGGGAYCGQNGTGSQVGMDGSQTGVSYTLYHNGVATSTVLPGTGSSLSFGNQTGAGNYTVSAVNSVTSCINNMSGSTNVSIDPQAPTKPSDPAGPAHVYTLITATNDYTTGGGNYASMYSWNLSPANAGTIIGAASTGTVTWNPAFVGIASVKVRGVNSCGDGVFSNEYPVIVDMNVGIPEAKPALFSVQPNPARDYLNIITTKNVTADLSILNSLGSVLITMTNLDIQAERRIDISRLGAGVYYVHLQNAEYNQMVRFVVE